MYLTVIEDDLIQNIQHAFQEQYPYLKLQFYKNPHQEGEASPVKERLANSLPIAEVTMFHTGGIIDINTQRTVTALEADFFHILGLGVQVLRQSGDLWLETTHTDCWTLQQQNEKGKASTNPIKEEQPEDFDLQDFN